MNRKRMNGPQHELSAKGSVATEERDRLEVRADARCVQERLDPEHSRRALPDVPGWIRVVHSDSAGDHLGQVWAPREQLPQRRAKDAGSPTPVARFPEVKDKLPHVRTTFGVPRELSGELDDLGDVAACEDVRGADELCPE